MSKVPKKKRLASSILGGGGWCAGRTENKYSVWIATTAVMPSINTNIKLDWMVADCCPILRLMIFYTQVAAKQMLTIISL